MQLNKKNVEAYFKAYPKKDVLFFTSDGFCFLEEDRAANHAKSKKLKYKKVEREVVFSKSDNNPGNDELTKEDAEAKLLEFELNEDADWGTVQDLGKALGVKAKKKDEYLAALTPIKEQLIKAKEA